MAITKPMLPPKKGYVEVEVHGKRTYKNVETGVLIENEVRKPSNDERFAALESINVALEEAMCEMDAVNQEEIAELQETTSALEEAMCEMDAANEERMAAIEEALCEMDMG